MNYKWLISLFLLIVFALLPYWFARADDSVAYVVTSGQSINARACPRLTCEVVRRYAPGETFNVAEIVAGDAVSGSTQWLHIKESALDAYVHSSLAAQSSADAPSSEPAASTSETEGWVVHNGVSFRFKTPTGYYNGAKLLADDDLLASFAETYGLDPKQLTTDIRDRLGETDMYLFKMDCYCWIGVWHEDLGAKKASVRQLEASLTVGLEDYDFEILDKQIVQLPAGDAVRLYMSQTSDEADVSYFILYGIITPAKVYYLEFNAPSPEYVAEAEYIATIAGTFEARPSMRDPEGRLSDSFLPAV